MYCMHFRLRGVHDVIALSRVSRLGTVAICDCSTHGLLCLVAVNFCGWFPLRPFPTRRFSFHRIVLIMYIYFCFPLIIQCDWCRRDALAELSWRTPSAAIVTVATFSVADRLYIGHTYIVLLWQDVLPSRLAAAFDHNRHLPPYLILCR